MNPIIETKLKEYQRARYEYKKKWDMTPFTFENFRDSNDEKCNHKYATIESHNFDDVGAWFTCPKCKKFSYVKKIMKR